ncbi:Calcium sensing receptor, chloroplastic [Apostasia shenzhenica]|uniref:Calcium sensing receptor, chloroplastic n=1 Tax=Apostasia shenzhenica TaxID=1088818 RepID=A0A2I0A4I2_9ASPA|nr:Calcium sensing receptor, chloroplastic [Apostasia shenzhenica]
MVMALRASAVGRPPHHQQKSNLKLRPCSSPHKLLSTSPSALTLLALFSHPNATFEVKALTLPKEGIVSSLTKVEETINQVGDAGSKVLEFSQNLIKVVSDALKPAVDVALPFLKSAGEEAVKVASPVVSEASKQAKEALQGAGVDPSPVLSAAKVVADAAQQSTKVIEGAKPIASSTLKTITSSDPSVIIVSAGALFLAYLLLPPIWSVVSFSFRGYKGNLSPAQTLDLLSSQNYILIDIRSEKDKNKAGVPRLPSNARSKIILIPLEELPSKLKGIVRNTRKVEAEIVALKISYLKRINKGSNIVIMDSYSDTAKNVARMLTSLSFKNSWVMAGGFSGSNGWLQSQLGVDSYNVAVTEILSPSRIIPAATARLGATSTNRRKLLPGTAEK